MTALLLLATIFASTPSIASLIEQPASINAFGDAVPFDGRFADWTSTNNATTAWFPVFATGQDDGDWVMRTAIEFDLSRVSTVKVAELIVMSSFAINTPKVELHGYRGDGLVTREDVRISNALANMTLQSSWNQALVELKFDVTPYVIAMLREGERYVGFSFRIQDDLTRREESATTIWSGRVDHDLSRGALGPRLVIAEVPEPGALALLGLGLAGLAATRRRKQ